MANEGVAILLLLLLMIGGVVMVFNLIPILGLGFGDITSFGNGFWIVVAKIVGLILIVLPVYVIWNIIKG